jgi:glucose-6-phosphate dehydrogenase assembly protein OpcA
VSLADAERALVRLWDEEEKRTGKPAAHPSLLTIAAIASEERLLPRAEEVLARVLSVHPARTIACVMRNDGEPRIAAAADLHRNAKGEALADRITLETYGSAREWLPDAIDRLVKSGLPSCVWWVGDLPDADDLFDRCVARCDIALVNSSEMDLRDLEKLARIVTSVRGVHAVGDLTWVRLRGMQDLIARFFDDPAARPYAAKIKEITIAYSPRDGEPDVASTRVGLLLGWLGHALRWRPETAKWQRGEVRSTLTISGVTVHVVKDRRENVHDGAVTRFEIVCDGARFELARQEDPRILIWSCEGEGICIPSQTLRFGSHEEPKLLARFLERPARDRLLEASLLTGSRIVQSVAPRLSSFPTPR